MYELFEVTTFYVQAQTFNAVIISNQMVSQSIISFATGPRVGNTLSEWSYHDFPQVAFLSL